MIKSYKKVLILLISFLTLFSCSKNEYYVDINVERNYEAYSSYELDSLDNFYSLSFKTYYIYLTSTECHECIEIKNHVLAIYELENNEDFHMFFYNTHALGSEEGKANREKFNLNEENYSSIYCENIMLENHVSSLKDTYFLGTPSIYEIKENKLNSIYLGIEETLNFIDSYIKIH